MDSYRCSKLVNADTKSQVISDTVEFRHSYLSVPAPSTEDRIIHGLQVVAGALTGASAPTSISQVESITNLWDIFESWRLLAPPLFQPPQIPMHICPRVPTQEPPRVVSPSPLTPAHSISSSPSWSPPPRPAVSTLLSPTTPFQATPRRLDFTGAPQGWGLNLGCHRCSLRRVSLHESPLPIAPAAWRRRRAHLRSSLREGPFTSHLPDAHGQTNSVRCCASWLCRSLQCHAGHRGCGICRSLPIIVPVRHARGAFSS
jgi:hypothetical protein